MAGKYLDALVDSKYKENVWKIVSLGMFGVVVILSVALCVVSNQLVSNIDRVRYILAPGIQTLETVRPGKLTDNYIEQSFLYVTEKLNSWSYSSIKGNYKVLFDNFYSGDLKVRTQANLRSQNYFDDVESRNLISFWSPDVSNSEFHWCGKVSVRKQIKGVACGIVTGERKLFADHNIPVSQEVVSYLIYAINIAPTQNNFFAVQVTRIKRGPLHVLKAELEASLKEGVLPSEEEQL